MIKRYTNFLKRSVHTLPHDITQPYHKITDLLFKLLALSLSIYGTYKIFWELHVYSVNLQTIANVTEKMNFTEQSLNYTIYFQNALIGILVGLGALIGAVFVSTILIVRHLNETLPDHIYLRCFSSLEEKQHRLPVQINES